ncbi:MAG: class I SAM-dependent methyltransferase [Alphaproteobacteria bacterium]|nr:class I SAM-dependent methyltransferase [Alphaproteobacteria bacterium]
MTTKTAHRFAFGDNWEKFSNIVSNREIDEAVENLSRIVQGISLDDKSFLDIGCGSGLHSLAAIRLGAKKVSAFDIDPVSVQTTQKLLSSYAHDAPVTIEEKSIFDAIPANEQDKYDIVYSWGVLHHTGDMWGAIKKAAEFVAADGEIVIAIYKKSPLCGFWRVEKSIYSRLPSLLQFPITLLFSMLYLVGISLKGKNPIKYVKTYRSFRGMNFWHDMIDWLGGYPYESATSDEMKNFFCGLGFKVVSEYNVTPVKAMGLFGCGCAEYVFSRNEEENEN